MSHVSAVKLVIKDLEAMKAACAELGLEFREGQKTYKWFGRWVNDYKADDAAYKQGIKPEDYGKCAHAIGIPGKPDAYEVGLVPCPDGAPGFLMVFDFFAGGRGLMEKIGGKKDSKEAGALSTAYAAQVTQAKMQALARQGYRITRTKSDDGKKLIFRASM